MSAVTIHERTLRCQTFMLPPYVVSGERSVSRVSTPEFGPGRCARELRRSRAVQTLPRIGGGAWLLGLTAWAFISDGLAVTFELRRFVTRLLWLGFGIALTAPLLGLAIFWSNPWAYLLAFIPGVLLLLDHYARRPWRAATDCLLGVCSPNAAHRLAGIPVVTRRIVRRNPSAQRLRRHMANRPRD
jgi:hypothetical protein